MNELSTTTYSPRCSSSELLNRITAHIEELAKAADAARLNEQMIRYLETCARFHRYSPGNVWLILMSRPEARQVAGFRQWQAMGRFVRRGEKGIAVLAPLLFHKDEKDPESPVVLRGFKVVYVFDISQTDGQALPEPPVWKSPEKNAELQERLLAFARDRGITVSFKKLPGEMQGVSKGGCIEIDPQAGTKTLIHEIAHELMHQGKDRPVDPGIRELEAESVAFVVCRHFEMEGLSSPNYVALHGATSDKILAHLERIKNTTVELMRLSKEDIRWEIDHGC